MAEELDAIEVTETETTETEAVIDPSGEEVRNPSLSQKLKKLEAEVKVYQDFHRNVVFKEAGFDPNKGVGKLLAKTYEGPIDVDALKAYAAEHGIDSTLPQAPAVPPTVDSAGHAFSGVDDLYGATATSGAPDLAAQIQEAEAAGDYIKSFGLKMDQVRR